MVVNLSGIQNAAGLSAQDAQDVEELASVIRANHGKHDERRMFYEDKVKPANKGMKMPRAYEDMPCATGWAAKTVNALAERSRLDGFTFDGDTPALFDDAMRENDVRGSYQRAVPSELIEGLGFWTVSHGGNGEPAAIVNYHSAQTASALWDYRRKRVRCGLAIADYGKLTPRGSYVPTLAYLYKADRIVTFSRVGNREWTASYQPNIIGAPLIVPMVYKAEDMKPFGRSRITDAVKTIVLMAMDELRSMAMQSGYYSIPQKYALGLSDGQYNAMCDNMHEIYRSDMFIATTNDDGGTPNFGMLQAASMEPHIAVLDKLANMMSSETALPLAAFGVMGNGYTSSDALRAANDDLVILAKSMDRDNARAMENVAKLMLAVIGNKPLSQLTEVEKTVTAHFADEGMPSDAANADAMLKVCSVAPEFAGTDVFWEKLGYGEDDRRRIKAATAANMNMQALVSRLRGANDDTV